MKLIHKYNPIMISTLLGLLTISIVFSSLFFFSYEHIKESRVLWYLLRKGIFAWFGIYTPIAIAQIIYIVRRLIQVPEMYHNERQELVNYSNLVGIAILIPFSINAFLAILEKI